MKIRTQDSEKYLDFGEAFVGLDWKGGGAVFVANQYHKEPVCIGTYSDVARAKGVLYELDLAYRTGQKVFYAPAE